MNLRTGGRPQLLVLVAGVAAAAVLSWWTPSDDPTQSVCIWRRTTGVACPGCGMVRAASHLLQGGWETAVGYHPLIVPMVVQAAVAWGWWTLAARGSVRSARPRTVTVWLLANLALLVGVWLVRAFTGTLPP